MVNLGDIVSDLYAWGQNNRKFLVATSLYCITAAADTTLTLYGVSHDVGTEANPIVKFFMENAGTYGVLTLEGLGSISCIYAARRLNANIILYIGSLGRVVAISAWLSMLSKMQQ